MRARDLSQPMRTVLRPVPPDFQGQFAVTVCVNVRPPSGILTVSCGPRGGAEIAALMEAEIARRALKVRFSTIKCLGLCEIGPNVRLSPSNSWFHGVHPSDVGHILDIVEAQLREAGL